MTNSIYEHKESTKFRKKHDKDKDLLKRILLKIQRNKRKSI